MGERNDGSQVRNCGGLSFGMSSKNFKRISSISPLSLAIAELEDVLFKNLTTPKSSGKEYDRALYNGYASNPKAAFQKLYMFSFNLVKPECVSSSYLCPS